LPAGFVRPSKEELRRMYVKEHMSTLEIGEKLGVSDVSIRSWLRDEGISIRNPSESRLPAGFVRPSKEELRRMYVKEHMSTLEIGEKLGVSSSTIQNWLIDYEIPIRSSKPSTSTERFMGFMQQDENACKIAYAATHANGFGYDIEKIIMDAYEGRFKDQKELHDLLKENADKIKALVENGVTNLGAYIGGFSLGERRIFQIVEMAVDSIPSERISASLEERMTRMLKVCYSPRFNDNPSEILKELEGKVSSGNSKTKPIYEGLLKHYQEVRDVLEELG